MQTPLFNDNAKDMYRIEDYIVQHRNKSVYNMVIESLDWSVLVLHGAEGSGKTHLAHVWSKHTNSKFLDPSKFLDHPFRGDGGFIIEDIDKISDHIPLLHCYNYIVENKIKLLMTSSIPPEMIKFNIRDLSSRISSILSIEISPPDNELVRMALVKYLSEKQLLIDNATIEKVTDYFQCSMRVLRKFFSLLEAELDKTKMTKTLILSLAQRATNNA